MLVTPGAYQSAVHQGHKAGRFYNPAIHAFAAGTAPVAATITAHPFMVPETMTVSDITARVTTLAASGNVQFAIYAADPTTDAPTGTALASTASMSTTTATVVNGALTANVQLFPNRLYWLAFNCDATGGGTCIMQIPNGATSLFGYYVGSATAADISSGANTMGCYLRSASTGIHAFNTWPDLTGVSLVNISTDTRYATGLLKVASVP